MRPEPQPAFAVESFASERASANKSVALEDGASAASTGAPIAASLDVLQRWFSDVVSDPRSLDEAIRAGGLVEGPSAIERVLTRGPRLTAAQRLSTYRHGYHARLVDCLADDYPAVQHALGDDAFADLARAYIVRFPSRSTNLNFYGQHFAGFVRERDEFLAELARLEWAMVQAIHAAMAPALTPEKLADIPTARWADARLPRSQAAQLLRLTYPVNLYFQAWRTGGAPTRPEPAPSATLVYRHELSLWRLDLPLPMADVLERLFGGGTLGDALEMLDESAAGDVMIWFREWVSGGVFADIVL